MTYGLYVENDTGITQIDSDTSDVGYVVTYNSNYAVNAIPSSEFSPKQGDLLFVKRPVSDNYYYFYIFESGGYWRFNYYNANNSAGKVPTLSGPGFGDGYLHCMVARPQNLAAISGNYGLQVKDASNKVTFDSRTYTGVANRFVIETVISAEQTRWSNDSESDGTIITQASNRWICANWGEYSSLGTKQGFFFGFQGSKILYYGGVQVDLSGIPGGGGLQTIRMACPSDILIATVK